MKYRSSSAIAFLTALSLAAFVTAKDPAPDHADKTEKTEKSKAETTIENDLELGDSYQKVADFAGIKDKKLDEFKQAVQDGQKKLDDWKSGKEGSELADLRKELQAARKEKNESKIQELEGKIEPLNKKLKELRNTVRAKVLGTLSEKEQSKVVTGTLNSRLINRFDEVKLTETQQSKIHELAESQTADYLKQHPLSEDPYMLHLIGVQSSLAKQIKSDILTEAQRKDLDADKPVKEKPAKESKETAEKPAKESAAKEKEKSN